MLSKAGLTGPFIGRPLAILIGFLAVPLASSSLARDLSAGWTQDGQASYYGNHWNGRRTSSGARFDQTKLTAAHASLPLGTRLLVTSASGDSVVVTVNDREPPHGDRIIDLSRAAASRLHMLGSGVAEVTIAPATAAEISAGSAEQDEEVAEAPDDGDDQNVATAKPSARVSHARHGPRHRHHARR